MDELIKQLHFGLKLRNSSPTTHETYERHLREFFAFVAKDPLHVTPKDVQSFQVHLVSRGLAPRTINTTMAAPKFFYLEVLGKDWSKDFLPWVRVKRKLPKLLTQPEIAKLIQVTSDFKMRVLFLTVYALGLRTCEVRSLTYKSIDSQRKLVHIIGKGGKERFVPLSDVLLNALRFYWKENKEDKWTWLFPCKSAPTLQCPSWTIRLHWQGAKNATGLTKVKGIHTLRHCYATHLLEAGVELRVIQILLGHALLSTTTFYTQLTQKHAAQIKNPLDLLVAAVDPRLKASGQD